MSELFVSVTPILVPVDEIYDYLVPARLEREMEVGALVVVPFGRRRIFAMIVKVSSTTTVPREKIREVEGLVGDFRRAPKDLLDLCAWISKMYMCPLHMVMEAAFPFHRKLSKRGIDLDSFKQLQQRTILEKHITMTELALAETVTGDFETLSAAPAQRRLMRILAGEGGTLSAKRLMALGDTTMSVINALEKRGYVAVDFLSKEMHGPLARTEKHHMLTPVQETAYSVIKPVVEKKEHEAFLLHGITGSGKTEIYMHAVRDCLAQGRKVIILVPEIALATQIISRFLRRFLGRIAIWHSMLSMTERLFEWKRITDGATDIVIGARSAVFAPVENLGLIVVDEEHEMSYKQESAPRYSAREAAIRRGKLAGCPVIMGSATPSMETIKQARDGKLRYLFLESRIGEAELPVVTVVDMKKQKTHRTTSVFSPPMVEAIMENMSRGEQTMVFLNHRGYSQFMQCFYCGGSIECDDCSVTMKYHKAENVLKCHMCGSKKEPPEKCPDCNSGQLRFHGVGTERIYNQLSRAFKDARIERMDRDTVSKKGEYQRIIEACERREVDILIGTQMIAKGLDFPGVTLVCVISADSIINLPDFRAAERTYQILTQVSGRAGRGENPGRVIIQTFNTEHPAIKSACAHDPQSFYNYELKVREEAMYPPFTLMINFVVTCEDESRGYDAAYILGEKLQAAIAAKGEGAYFSIMGPAPAAYFKLHGKYRYFVNMRGVSIKRLIAVARDAMDSMPKSAQSMIAVDVGPHNML